MPDAAGIPSRADYGDLAKLAPGLVDFVIQRHRAERAGLHNDIRLGTPDTGLYSWATKHELPEPGARRALFQQPLHSHAYGAFEGRIPSGYGKGDVRVSRRGQVLVTDVRPDRIEFTTADQRHPERFALLRPRKWGAKDWLLINRTTLTKPPYDKVRYRKIPADQVESAISQMQQGDTLERKLDGASTLIQLLKDGVELTSYRTSKTTGRPITHTERMFGSAGKLAVPPELVGTVLKGELYGVRGQGGLKDMISPQELGSLLNSTLGESLRRQHADDVRLKAMIYDIQQLGKNPIDSQQTPRLERRKLIEQVLRSLPADKFHISEAATTPEEAQKLWSEISGAGYSPATEGVVHWPLHGTPAKSKLVEEQDVHLTGTFPGEGKYKGVGVGGFTYANEPGGPTIGRVGTGLSDALRQEAQMDPAAFVGRVARIRAQHQYPSGAWRAPSLLALHEDYPTQEKAARSAVIIKGNPARQGADTYGGIYEMLAKHLQNSGYDVSFDPGEPFTTPPQADVWLGHSRGADRLRFATEAGVPLTIPIGSKLPGAVNHPDDQVDIEPDAYDALPAETRRAHNTLHADQWAEIRKRLAALHEDYPTSKTAARTTTHTATRNGQTYDISALLARLAARQTTRVPLPAISRSSRDGFSPQRYAAANVSFPIVLDETGRLWDGRHRVAKLQDAGESEVDAQIATQEDLDAVKQASTLLGDLGVTIDRPKGYRKVFQTLQGPVTQEYPVDYGYFNDLINPDDNEELDVFVGSGGPHYGRFMKGRTLSGTWEPDERKWYHGLDDAELAAVMAFFEDQDGDLLRDKQTFKTPEELLADIRAAGQLRSKTAAGAPVIRGERMRREEFLICPHCRKQIGEKELYYDGEEWFHRPCEDDGPIEMPGPGRSLLAEFGLDKEAAVGTSRDEAKAGKHAAQYELGQALVLLARSAGEKQGAAAPELSYSLKGKLLKSQSGWLLLQIPNALARGAFEALHEPGAELPPDFNAHISVMRPEELATIEGGADAVKERGKDFAYTLGPVRSVTPAGWNDMSKVWYIEVRSPELQQLRRSYGLASLPNNGKFQFHITFAVRRKGALTGKSASLLYKFGEGVWDGAPADAPPADLLLSPGDPQINVLDELKALKQHSDRGDYAAKHRLARKLLSRSAADFVVDSRTGKIVGVTHQPTGFRFHLPATVLPAEFPFNAPAAPGLMR